MEEDRKRFKSAEVEEDEGKRRGWGIQYADCSRSRQFEVQLDETKAATDI